MSSGKRILAGTAIAAVVIAGLGYGATLWVQRKALAEVEGVFAGLRTTLAKADHGPVVFSIWDRSIKISNIVLLPRNMPADAPVTIAQLDATGLNVLGGRVSAAKVEIRSLEGTQVTAAGATTRQKIEVPAITISGLSVATSSAGQSATSVGKVAQAFAAITAASITAPMIKTNVIVMPATTSVALAMPTNLQQTFSNVRVDGLNGGKVQKLSAERWNLTGMMPPPKPGQSGALSIDGNGIFVTGYDIAGVLAMLDTEAPTQSAAGAIALAQSAGIGATTFKVGNDLTGSIVSATYSDMGLDTQKYLQMAKAIQATQAPSVMVTPDQQKAILSLMAELYEGIRIGKFEGTGIAIDVTGAAPFKLAAFTIENWIDGTIGSFGFAGLDARTPQGDKVAVGRFALKGIKVADLLRIRMTGQLDPQFATPGQQPPSATDVLRLFSGVELESLIAPALKPGQPPVAIEAFKANWAELIGRTPVDATVSAKFSVPVPADAPEPYASLSRGGLKQANVRLDGKWKWHATTQTFAVGPVDLAVQDAFAASATINVANVSRAVINAGPELFANAAPDFQIGPVVLTVKDLGLFSVVAKDPKLNEVRLELIDGLTAAADGTANDPQVMLAQGMLKLFAAPNGQLSINVTPKSVIRVGDLMALGAAGPELAQYLIPKVDVRVTANAP